MSTAAVHVKVLSCASGISLDEKGSMMCLYLGFPLIQMVTKMGILEFSTTLKIVFLAIVSLKFQGLEWFLILFLIFPPFHLLRQKEFPVILLQVRLTFQFLQYSAQTLTQYLHLALTA